MYPNSKKMLCLLVIIMSMMMLTSSLFATHMLMMVGKNGNPIPASSINSFFLNLNYIHNGIMMDGELSLSIKMVNLMKVKVIKPILKTVK